MTVFFKDFLWSPSTVQINALFQRLCYFLITGRHLISFFQTEHGNLCIGTSATDSCRIDCHVTAADNHNISFKCKAFFRPCFSQEINCRISTLCIFSADSRFSSFLTANSRIKSFITLLSQFFNCNILANFHTTANLYTHFTDNINFCRQKIFFQLIRWNTVAQHTARFRIFLKYGWLITCQCQIIRTGKTCRTCADDCDLLVESTTQ